MPKMNNIIPLWRYVKDIPNKSMKIWPKKQQRYVENIKPLWTYIEIYGLRTLWISHTRDNKHSTSSQWHNVAHFEHKPSQFYLWFHPKVPIGDNYSHFYTIVWYYPLWRSLISSFFVSPKGHYQWRSCLSLIQSWIMIFPLCNQYGTLVAFPNLSKRVAG